jgi:hypothetical protein
MVRTVELTATWTPSGWQYPLCCSCMTRFDSPVGVAPKVVEVRDGGFHGLFHPSCRSA